MEKFKSNKVVHGKKMNSTEWESVRSGFDRYSDATVKPDQDGYMVCYGKDTDEEYYSWSPKAQFENGNSKMTNGEFGINHTEDCVDIIFGDGKTGVQALGYDDGLSGIVICRDGKHSEAFGFNDDKDTYLSKEDKVFIRADNTRSLQVIIDQLEEAKAFIR